MHDLSSVSEPRSQVRIEGHILPGLFFAAVPTALFLPITLTGSLIFGSADLYFHLQNRLYPVRWFKEMGVIPLWNPYVNSGMPFLGDPQSSLFSPFSLFFYLLPVHWAQFCADAFAFFLAGFFFYLFMMEIVHRRLPAVFSGLVYSLNSVTISQIFNGNLCHLSAYSLIPAVFFLAERGLQRQWVWNFVAAGVPLALMVFCGHTQYVLYTVTVLIPYLAGRTRQLGRPWTRTVRYYATMGVSALCFAAPQLLPSWEFRLFSNRANGLSFWAVSRDSLPPQNLLTLIMPYFFGCPGTNTLWQSTIYAVSNIYFGIASLALGVIAVRTETESRWRGAAFLFGSLWVFAILMTLGRYTPLYRLFYYFVPGYDTFRAPGRFQVFVGFSQATLAGIGLDRLLYSRSRADVLRQRTAVRILGVAAGVMFFVFGGMFCFREPLFRRLEPYGRGILYDLYYNRGRGQAHSFEYYVNRMPVALNMIIGQGIRASVFLGISAALAGVALRRRRPSPRTVGGFFLIALLADNATMARPMIKPCSIQVYFGSHPALEFLKKHRVSERVLWHDGVLRYQGGMWSGIRDVRGYNPVVIQKYLELLAANDQRCPNADMFFTFLDNPDGPFLRLLNVGWFLREAGSSSPSKENWRLVGRFRGLRFRHVEYKDFQMIFSTEVEVFRARNPLPRAWFVNSVVSVSPRTDVLKRMQSEDFDPVSTAYCECPVAAAQRMSPKREGTAQAILKDETPNRLVFLTRSKENRLLVLSEIWYPGWRGYIDGRLTPIWRTDHALRGVEVPAGEHTVTLVYRPGSFRLGLIVMVLAVMTAFGAVWGVHFIPGRKRRGLAGGVLYEPTSDARGVRQRRRDGGEADGFSRMHHATFPTSEGSRGSIRWPCGAVRGPQSIAQRTGY